MFMPNIERNPDTMTDAEWRAYYKPQLAQLEIWRRRLAEALSIGVGASMEAIVMCVERDKGANVVPLKRRCLEPRPAVSGRT